MNHYKISITLFSGEVYEAIFSVEQDLSRENLVMTGMKAFGNEVVDYALFSTGVKNCRISRAD